MDHNLLKEGMPMLVTVIIEENIPNKSQMYDIVMRGYTPLEERSAMQDG
jgi:hypothetical protein